MWKEKMEERETKRGTLQTRVDNRAEFIATDTPNQSFVVLRNGPLKFVHYYIAKFPRRESDNKHYQQFFSHDIAVTCLTRLARKRLSDVVFTVFQRRAVFRRIASTRQIVRNGIEIGQILRTDLPTGGRKKLMVLDQIQIVDDIEDVVKEKTQETPRDSHDKKKSADSEINYRSAFKKSKPKRKRHRRGGSSFALNI